MRIVSLSPACTEWVAAFEGVGDLVGRSHGCDVPPEVLDLPVVTRSEPVATPAGRRRRTEAWFRTGSHDAAGPLIVDLPLLAGLNPGLILTELRPDECAELEAAFGDLNEGTRPPARVVSMHAATMKQVLSRALNLGQAIGKAAASMQKLAGFELRLRRLRDRLGLERTTELSRLPSVVLLDGLDPPAAGGHWIPDVIVMAGGRPVCAHSGSPSTTFSWEALRRNNPDVIGVAATGVDLGGARRSVRSLTRRGGWDELAAVRAGRVMLFDGSAYFNRPGPRLYRSTELLAAALYGPRAGVDAAPHEMARMQS